ncbi:MAG: hypothetical protein KF721_15495 [Ignavibacteriaceae bacterium]|nr:hypothetical protein [Ignavibacteriaceae bacterium]
MIKKDDIICSIINSTFRLIHKLNIKEQNLLRKMADRKFDVTDNEIFIVLNSPSLQKQDLSVLQGKTLMFVNRGFHHPLYKELQPKFHTFIDPKMLNGKWPVTWLDEILELSPNVTFIMPVTWASKKQFWPYIERGVSFYWMPIQTVCDCLGVAGECFQFAIKQNIPTIYFTGFEASGIAYELIKTTSHFYGTNEENLKKSTKDQVIDLLMHSRHLHDLNRFAEMSKAKGISLINLTEGGLLDMFPRMNLKEIGV